MAANGWKILRRGRRAAIGLYGGGGRWLRFGRVSATLLLVLMLAGHATAWGQESEKAYSGEAVRLRPDVFRGLEIFRLCAKCHYPEGWGQRNGTFPQIAGQHANVLIKQLADVRERTRGIYSMDHFVMMKDIHDPQALADVSAYVSGLLMTPEPGVGPGVDLEHGALLYETYCAACHGATGEGSNEHFVPRIQGQHYNYLVRQFRLIYSRERLNAHPGMLREIAGFSERDAQAVLDYVSRLSPPKEDVAPRSDWKNPDFE